MISDPILQELFRAKYEIAAENGMDTARVVEAIRHFNAANPPPPTPAHRKLIEGHPVGRSVMREDDTLRELREIKESLSRKYPIASAQAKAAKANANTQSPKTAKATRNQASAAFRAQRGKPNARRHGNGSGD